MKTDIKLLIVNVIALILLCVGLYSCQKYDFDFSNINSAELDGDWGVPLVNTTYYADQVLNILDADNFTQRPDGMLQYTYDISAEEIVKGSELMELSDQLQAFKNYAFVVPPAAVGSSVPINGKSFKQTLIVDNRNFQIQNGEIKSGSFQFEIDHNIFHVDSVIISTHNLLDINQHFFRYVMRGSYDYQSIDVTNYKLIPNNDSVNNALVFTTKIYGRVQGSTQQQNCFMSLKITAQHLQLKYVYGKMSPYYVHVSELLPVRVFSDNFTGSVDLLNPVYHINVDNSFGSRLGFVVDTAGFCSDGNSYSAVMNQGSFVTCQAAPNRGVFAHDQQQYSQSSIYYNENLNKFKLSGDVIVNPHGYSAGTIFVDENSTINIHTDLEIPFHANVDYLEFCDTTGNILEELRNNGDVNSYSDAIKKLTLKCGFTNGLPVMVDAQLFFVDTNHTQYLIVDSLLSTPRLLGAALTDANGKVTSPTTSIANIEITNDKFDKVLQRSNNTVLRFRIYATKPVKIYTSQYLKAKIGMRVEYDTENITVDL